jgi:hypothetical protein
MPQPTTLVMGGKRAADPGVGTRAEPVSLPRQRRASGRRSALRHPRGVDAGRNLLGVVPVRGEKRNQARRGYETE